MKRFKDLELTGPDESLLSLVDAVSAALPRGWVRDREAERRLTGISPEGEDAGFAFARDASEEEPPSGLFLARESRRLYVPNIVPRESGRLSTEQYNRILDEFVEILRDHLEDGDAITMAVTGDESYITDWVSPDAADLLRRFSTLANQSTGSSHPSDFKRWAAFLVQVHREGSSLHGEALGQWLVEELDWPNDRAHRLVIEYEFARNLLRAYDETE